MKMIMKILTVILICAMLAGCGSNSAPQEIAVAPTGNPEPTASLDSTLIETTDAETEAPTEEPIPFVVEIKPVITEAQNHVTVTTVDEFLAAIAPNTEIIVDAELIDLSKATGYGKTNGDNYHEKKEYTAV
jgi:PBP1b-binding outer membrane lipoprotein LpoB